MKNIIMKNINSSKNALNKKYSLKFRQSMLCHSIPIKEHQEKHIKKNHCKYLFTHQTKSNNVHKS